METAHLIDRLEQAQQAYDEALDRVRRGEIWLRSHTPAHPQYQDARALLATRRAELKERERKLTKLAQQFNVAGARECGRDFIHDVRGPLSTNCQVCGQPVHGWPAPQPGHYVHLECLDERYHLESK